MQAGRMGEILRLARGCYLDATDSTFVARCGALLMANPADTVLVGGAAAALHGLWLPRAPTAEFATAQPGGRSAQMPRARKPEFQTHRRAIPSSHQTVIAGIPVPSLARTWWDLAA